MSMIPSACFSVSAGANGHYTLSGGGFGHGIGFSQYGADKLAKADKVCEMARVIAKK